MSDEGTLTASDLRDMAGLSYRQLNDWDSKGALPARKGKGWRRYSPRDIFVIMVCAEIRKRFGVPLESVRDVREFMSKKGANHLVAAIELMATLGQPVLILTDLKGTFVLDTDLDITDLLARGLFRNPSDGAFILLKLNSLVNKLLACLKQPIQLPEHGLGLSIAAEFMERNTVQNEGEEEVLRLIGDQTFRRIEAITIGGGVRTLRGEQELELNQLEDLTQLIA